MIELKKYYNKVEQIIFIILVQEHALLSAVIKDIAKLIHGAMAL